MRGTIPTSDGYGDKIITRIVPKAPLAMIDARRRAMQMAWHALAVAKLPERGQAREGYDRTKRGKVGAGRSGHGSPTQTGDGCGSSVCQHPRIRARRTT